jgi:hypothetical protein
MVLLFGGVHYLESEFELFEARIYSISFEFHANRLILASKMVLLFGGVHYLEFQVELFSLAKVVLLFGGGYTIRGVHYLGGVYCIWDANDPQKHFCPYDHQANITSS